MGPAVGLPAGPGVPPTEGRGVGWCAGGAVGAGDAVGAWEGGGGSSVVMTCTPLRAMRCGFPKELNSTRRRKGVTP